MSLSSVVVVPELLLGIVCPPSGVAVCPARVMLLGILFLLTVVAGSAELHHLSVGDGFSWEPSGTVVW